MKATTKNIPHTHMFFGNAGGTGKTLLAAALADYFQSRGMDVRCWNADPTCPSLEDFSGLTVKPLKWSVGESSSLGSVLQAAAGSKRQISVIDFGPGGFLDLFELMLERDMMTPEGWQMHLPLTLSRLRDTRYSMRRLLHRTDRPRSLVLWLNQLHGPLMPKQALNDLCLWPQDLQGWLVFGDPTWGLERHDFWAIAGTTFTLAMKSAQTEKRTQARLKTAQLKLRASLDKLYGASEAQ